MSDESLRVMVCVKMVPDMDMVIPASWEIDNLENEVDIGYVNRIMNCFDENALELALKLGDACPEDTYDVHVMTVGKQKCDKVLRTALSYNVQRGIRVDHEVKNNPSAVANIICHTIEKTGPYGVMLFGLQAGEYDNGQTGLIVAEILRLPCITHVMNIKKDADNLIVTHQTDLGIQELQVNTPVVLVVGNTKDANLRIPTIRERLASKNKDIEIIRISELGINNPDKDRRKGGKLFSQIKKRECQMIKGVSGRDKAVSLQKIVNRLNL